MRFPLSVKLRFGIGPVTAPGEQASPLHQLYIASVLEETAPFQGNQPASNKEGSAGARPTRAQACNTRISVGLGRELSTLPDNAKRD